VLGWLALNAADNYSRRFWTYFIGALQAGMASTATSAPPVYRHPLDYLFDLLQADPPVPDQAVMDGLVVFLSIFFLLPLRKRLAVLFILLCSPDLKAMINLGDNLIIDHVSPVYSLSEVRYGRSIRSANG